MEKNVRNNENVNSGLLASIYKAGLKEYGVKSKKGVVKLNGIFANPSIVEKPVLTIQHASGRDIFTIVKDAC